ncbi:MAG: glycosyltransferase family A protein [Pseudomonadota bacterium]
MSIDREITVSVGPVNQPFVSVIIPTYNRLALLKESVESVRRQSFKDFQIIVVDDGCTDDTGEWLDAQPDLSALHQSNSGIADSRNNGASIAAGRWLAFLDHDDLWLPDKLLVQTDFAKENPELGLIAARHERLSKYRRPGRSGPSLKGDLFVKVFSESFIHTSSVMIRKDVFESIGGFPTRYRFADEFDVWLKLAAAHPIGFIDETLVFIRFYESNTSHNRVGVRSDTYDILIRNHDPDRIPTETFLKTMSDHDISFGRAYVNNGDLVEAVKWFRKSVERTPRRFRSWRYFMKYGLKAWWMKRSSE